MFKSKKILIGAFIVIFIIFYFIYRPTVPTAKILMNGNDKKNIVKTIQSLNEQQRSIEIIKIFDFKERRYVAYLHDDIPAYIYFEKTNLAIINQARLSSDIQILRIKRQKTFKFFHYLGNLKEMN